MSQAGANNSGGSGGSGILSVAGDTGTTSGPNVTLTGDSTGLTFAVSGSTIDLGGDLNVAHGGTGAATLTGIVVGHGTGAFTASPVTQFDVLVGGASNAVTSISPSTSGFVLTSNGTLANPSFQAASGGSGIVTLDGNTGSATGSTVTIATPPTTGTINLSGTSSTLTLNLMDGSGNLAIGNGTTISAGSNSILFGTSSSLSGSNSIVLGNTASVTGGTGSIVLGDSSTTASSNSIVIGNSSTNVGGSSSVLIGLSTSNSSNNGIVIGNGALTTGNSNCISIGTGANTNGTSDIALGNGATTGSTGQQDISIGTTASATGGNSIVIGYTASDSMGSNNTVVGNAAIGGSGGYNTVLGNLSGSSYSGSEKSNILIANAGVAAETNVIHIGTQGIGNGQQSACYIAGITGVTVTGASVLCSTAGQLGTVVSSRRYKDNIEPIASDEDFLSLTPVSFSYKTDPNKVRHYGLIAEEVARTFPALVLFNDKGEPDSVAYHEMPALLLVEIKKLKAEIELLKNKLK